MDLTSQQSKNQKVGTILYKGHPSFLNSIK